MRKLLSMLTTGLLLGSSCAVPKPEVGPAGLVGDTTPTSPEFDITGCESANCDKRCSEVPDDRREACSAAYEAGCFSATPPPEYDCEEFGASPAGDGDDATRNAEDDTEQPLPDDNGVESDEEDESSPLLERPHPD